MRNGRSLRSRKKGRCYDRHIVKPPYSSGDDKILEKVAQRRPFIHSSLHIRNVIVLCTVGLFVGFLLNASFLLRGEIEITQTNSHVGTIRQHIGKSPRGSLEAKKRLPTTTNDAFAENPYERLAELELQLGSLLQQDVVSCRKDIILVQQNRTHTINQICSYYSNKNFTSTQNRLVVYNPSKRDKFLCSGKIVLGPKKWKLLSNDVINKCGNDLAKSPLRAHSFPHPPMYENRNQFPGIVAQSYALNVDDGTFSSDTVSNMILSPFLQSSSGSCDVKCYVEPSTSAVSSRYIYGTNWEFIYSMEGEKYWPKLKLNATAWKEDKFYATISRKSEIPLNYYSSSEYNIQSSPVPFSSGIKGASFLAHNCASLNNREYVVQKLMNITQNTHFRIDSHSTCLRNVQPHAGQDLRNKNTLMRKYLFHLAFENQNTEDYITEKLWGALAAGVIPVYMGAPNAKDFFPFKAIIFVDDFSSVEELADHLMKVSQDEKLYESFHLWRSKALPQIFLDRFNATQTHPSCRMCRFVHARKYGLGFDYKQQIIQPMYLSREACVDGFLRRPAIESWWSFGNDAQGYKSLQSLGFTPASKNGNRGGWMCPLSRESEVAQTIIGSKLTRTISSHDGITDIYLEGLISKTHVLMLDFPMKDHEPFTVFDSHTVWIQDDSSRISLVIYSSSIGQRTTHIDAKSGRFVIKIEPGSLPIQIRIIVENKDIFHEGADRQQTYYGKIMAEDLWNRPELFALTKGPMRPALAAISEDHQSYSIQAAHKASRRKGARTRRDSGHG